MKLLISDSNLHPHTLIILSNIIQLLWQQHANYFNFYSYGCKFQKTKNNIVTPIIIHYYKNNISFLVIVNLLFHIPIKVLNND